MVLNAVGVPCSSPTVYLAAATAAIPADIQWSPRVFVAFRTPAAWLPEVTEALERSGYAVDEMVKTSRGTLFVAVRRDGTGP